MSPEEASLNQFESYAKLLAAKSSRKDNLSLPDYIIMLVVLGVWLLVTFFILVGSAADSPRRIIGAVFALSALPGSAFLSSKQEQIKTRAASSYEAQMESCFRLTIKDRDDIEPYSNEQALTRVKYRSCGTILGIDRSEFMTSRGREGFYPVDRRGTVARSGRVILSYDRTSDLHEALVVSRKLDEILGYVRAAKI